MLQEICLISLHEKSYRFVTQQSSRHFISYIQVVIHGKNQALTLAQSLLNQRKHHPDETLGKHAQEKGGFS